MKNLLLGLVVLLAACGSPPTAPTPNPGTTTITGIARANGSMDVHNFVSGMGHYTGQVVMIAPNPDAYIHVGIGTPVAGGGCNIDHMPSVVSMREPSNFFVGELGFDGVHCVGVINANTSEDSTDLTYSLRLTYP